MVSTASPSLAFVWSVGVLRAPFSLILPAPPANLEYLDRKLLIYSAASLRQGHRQNPFTAGENGTWNGLHGRAPDHQGDARHPHGC